VPITIVPAPPHNVIGPGIPMTLQSSVFGPFPDGTQFQVDYFPPVPDENVWASESFLTTGSSLTVWPLSTRAVVFGPGRGQPKTGDQVPVTVQLNEPSGTVDSGTVTLPWDAQQGQPVQAVKLAQEATGGGLTDAQAQQLDQIHAEVAPFISLDALTLTDLTGGVPSDFVSAQLPDAIFGVIVRLTQIPAQLETILADNNYWRQTLAVVHVFRGSDLWLRAPIHTSNRMVPFPQEGIVTAAAENELTAWLLQMSLQVTFAPGVLGLVFLMKYP